MNKLSFSQLECSSGHSMVRVTAAFLLAFAGLGLCTASTAVAQSSAATSTASEEGPDTLIFKDGKTLRGTVLSESAGTVRFKGKVAGIDFETEYNKTLLLKVIKGERKPADAKAAATTDVKSGGVVDGTAASSTDAKKTEVAADLVGKTPYYWIMFEGTLGEQISQTPLREAFRDARSNGVQTIVIDYRPTFEANERSMLPELTANFSEIFRAEPIAEVFTDDVKKDWPKTPRIVFWVHDARGGASLLPLVCPELYFTSTAILGGIGDLESLFDGVGDEVVRQKQRSLRMGHAEGWAYSGGYDTVLIRAMSYPSFVLSYRMKDGKPELFEGYPKNPGEELLTDDAKDNNRDSLDDVLRGTGNDVLNINARIGEILGVNKKTVDTKDDLLAAMDIAITGVEVSGRSKAIMRDWTQGVESTKRQLRKLRADFDEVRVEAPGGYDQRTRERGQRRTILEQILRLQKGRFGEALSPRWLGENGIPGEVDINVTLESIRIQQTKDRK